jgi:hypothetical protein
MTPYGTPLPDSLQPGSLLTTFYARAAELGHPEYTSMTPRELRDAAQPVRMLDTTDAAIHALNTARLCSLCSDPGHLLRDCPFQSKLNDPAIRKAIGLPPLKKPPFKLRQSLMSSLMPPLTTSPSQRIQNLHSLIPRIFRAPIIDRPFTR